jgi:hypothetical protein
MRDEERIIVLVFVLISSVGLIGEAKRGGERCRGNRHEAAPRGRHRWRWRQRQLSIRCARCLLTVASAAAVVVIDDDVTVDLLQLSLVA